MSASDVTVVLAHGAWADGSSWAKVIGPLAAEGIRSVAAPLPLTSFGDDVAALERTLERVTGRSCWPVTPMPAPSSRQRAPRRSGRLSMSLRSRPTRARPSPMSSIALTPHPQAPKLAPDAQGLIYLPEEAFAAAFAQHATAEEQACWPRFSGRSRRPASPSPSTGRCGRTVPPGSWSRSRTA